MFAQQIYNALTDQAKSRTSLENVQDVLEALKPFIKNRGQVSEMPGTPAFTMVAFYAGDVPLGSVVYTIDL